MNTIGQWFNFIANRNKGITDEEVFRMMKAIDAKSGIAGYKPNYLFGIREKSQSNIPLIPDLETLLRFQNSTSLEEDQQLLQILQEEHSHNPRL